MHEYLGTWRVSRLKDDIQFPRTATFIFVIFLADAAHLSEHIMQLRVSFSIAIWYTLKTTDDNGRFIIAVRPLYREFVRYSAETPVNCARLSPRARLGFNVKRVALSLRLRQTYARHSKIHARSFSTQD